MPIELNFILLKEFSKQDLKRISHYRLTSLCLALVAVIINFFVYFSVTYLSFNYTGFGEYFFIYSFFLGMIDTFYWFTWTAITIASFSLLLNVYLLRFTLNPFIEILKNRKDQDQKKLTQEILDYKKTVAYRLYCQTFLMVGMIIHLMYYPRNVSLFYPSIGCNPLTGNCLIAETVYIPFVIVMSGFLIVLLGLYSSIGLINVREYTEIQHLLNPLKEKKKLEERNQQLELRLMRQRMSIEERRNLKIEQLRESYRIKAEKKRDKMNFKFKVMLEKEQYGKKSVKKLKQDERKDLKEEIEKIKKKKDEYDFT
jgi:hypothetical protein